MFVKASEKINFIKHIFSLERREREKKKSQFLKSIIYLYCYENANFIFFVFTLKKYCVILFFPIFFLSLTKEGFNIYGGNILSRYLSFLSINTWRSYIVKNTLRLLFCACGPRGQSRVFTHWLL